MLVLTTYLLLALSLRFTKTYRVNQIMKHAARFRRIKLTPTDVMKPMAVLLFLNVVVLTCWTILDPLHSEAVVISQDQFLRDLETYSELSRLNEADCSIFLVIQFILFSYQLQAFAPQIIWLHFLRHWVP